jgi:carbamoyl-phosphate synthase large subunit
MVEYFKNALKGDGYVFASNSVLTYSLKQADDYIITPCINDKDYIDFLLEYCNKKSINALIPLFDIDLPILSRNIKRFEEIGTRLIVSSEKAIDICNDKWETYRFLSSLGLKQPQTYMSVKSCKEDLSKGKIEFPLIIKPRWGMGSIGIFDIDAEDDLDILYKKLHKTIFNSYLYIESNQDINSSIVIQEKITGKEFGLDILNDLNGLYITTVAKQKLAMRAGETDIARIVDSSMFLTTSKIIAESLKHIGNLDTDCFVTENKEIYILEMNCRFGGQYPFSHLSGVDFPAQIIRWCNNEKTDEKLLHFQEGLLLAKNIVPVII